MTQTKKQLLLKASKYGVKSLLNIDANAKTIKGSSKGFQTAILYLLPDDKLCPASKIAGCRDACLVHAGRAAIYQSINKARKNRSDLFHNDNALFMALLFREIKTAILRAEKRSLTPVFRLNGTSDIDWTLYRHEGKTVFEAFKNVQFYDYTKRSNIIRKSASVSNWHMTASYSAANERYRNNIVTVAQIYGVNLAVVFDQLPKSFLNQKVMNGDESDLRFLDERGIVGLRAKGGAKKDNTGFVQFTKDIIARA